MSFTATESLSQPVPSTDLPRLILPSVLAVGVLDAIYATVMYVVVLDRYSVVGTLQYITAGLLGDAAFEGGLATAAMGVGIHFALTAFFAALYAVVAQRVPAIRDSRGVLVGLLYGAAIWTVMSQVVFPFTRLPADQDGFGVFLAFVVGHALFVGLPIAMPINARLGQSARLG